METVIRHTVITPPSQEQIKRRADLFNLSITGIKRDLRNVDAFLLTCQSYAGYLALTDPDSPELCRVLRAGARGAAALFEAASTTAETVTVRIDDTPPVSVSSAIAHATGVHVGNWRKGFWMAAICRDYDALDTLCRVPLDVLRRSPVTSDEYYYLYADALRRCWQHEPGWTKYLLNALDATDPGRIDPEAVNYVLYVIVPEIDLLFKIGERDEAGYNASLVKALEAHRVYWRRMERTQPSPESYLALGPLALTCLAYDAQISIDVESDYIPRRIVQGDCAVRRT